MPQLVHRPASSLPQTTLPWLTLRDHFVATVGEHAGKGRRLGPLLVLADATFAPHSRFPLHPHREMEILSYVIDGELSHHGDQANGATLRPRGAQLISARSGMRHAEGNDTDRPTRMLQLWVEPSHSGGDPEYFARQLTGRGREIVAGDGTMPLRADVRVWSIALGAQATERLVVAPGRIGYLLSLTAPVKVEDESRRASLLLQVGDGAEVGEGAFVLSADASVAVLWVDLPLHGAPSTR